MKAIFQNNYGPPGVVLQLRDIAMPVPGDDDVLVRVRAASVHPDVWHVVTGRPFVLRLMGAGLLKPKLPVPGTDLAGVVEAVGRNVTRFRPGDAVFGECIRGIQWTNGGAFAEYATAPQDGLAHKPEGISFEQAAAVPTSGLIALNNLHHLDGRPAKPRVLINGAAGGVGSLAVQLAKARGARVTGVDLPGRLDLVRSFGADQAVDCTTLDLASTPERYDLILDVASTLSFKACQHALTPDGIYVLIGHDHYGRVGGHFLGGLPHFFELMARSVFDRRLPKLTSSVPTRKQGMATLQELLAARKLTPLIAGTYPLARVPEAISHLQSGEARGKIIITP